MHVPSPGVIKMLDKCLISMLRDVQRTTGVFKTAKGGNKSYMQIKKIFRFVGCIFERN